MILPLAPTDLLPKIIMGVDPGTNIMGYALIEVQGQRVKVLRYDVIDMQKMGSNHALKLKKIFERMLELASSARDAGLAASGRAGVVTYSRKVFIPLTTLCRDRCHYCIFVDTPGQLLKLHKPVFMSPEQVLTVARQGAALGCKEALLTLGDRPEDRWPEARAWLDEHGVPYDEIWMGKPWPGRDGFYVDDRTVRPREFLNNSLEELAAICERDRVL